ncbi:MAG: TrmJ/YjtD family RNA methyltransferase [Spirochaetales bacterium]|nr:TrmJ/YjtD family RNA methyltransferase [Spirochaetales bacterium]
MTPADIRIVLVRPKEDRNIGSVCRAMKTMGFAALRIVGRQTIDRREAAATAVHAVDVLDGAVRCRSLAQAVEDSVLVAGVSRRRGKWRKYFALTPEQLAERVAAVESGTCTLVFGNEASGLNIKELSHCHLAVRIPSSPLFPSLNLSHAVQIVTYQLFRRLNEMQETDTFHPISGDGLDALVSLMIASLSNIGFFTQGDPQEMAVFLRDVLARATLEQREAERLARIFRKISGLIAGSGIEP